MTVPVILFAVMLAFIVLGVVGLILVVSFWESVGSFLGEDWLLVVTILTKVIQVIAGITSLFAAGGPTGANPDVWFSAKFAGLFCIVLWEVIEKALASRVRAAEKAEKQTLQEQEAEHAKQLAALQRESVRRTELLTVFRTDMGRRFGQLADARTRKDIRSDIGRARIALRPDAQVVEYLLILATTLAAWIKTEHNEDRNIRVGLYVNRDGMMTPVFTFNRNSQADRIGTLRVRRPEAFRLDGGPAGRSHVVACVKQKGMILVSDCEAAVQAGEFHFFHDDQRKYLKSMVAYYLGEVVGEDGEATEAALVADTDFPGFFNEDDRASFEFCLREFGNRLQYERLLAAVIERKAVNHEQQARRKIKDEEGLQPPGFDIPGTPATDPPPGDAEGS